MATIKDVAQRASVSIATVSRVLNRKGAYTKETEEIVRKTARELGYTPNLTAKGLKTGLTGTIAVVMHGYMLLSFPHLLYSIVSVVKEHNYGVEIVAAETFDDCAELTRSGKYDGLLISGITGTSGALGALVKAGGEFVILGENIEREDVNLVEIDYFQGGYVATQHLIHSGHKKILFIQNTTIPFSPREILRGYLFAHDENGIQYSEELIYQKGEVISEIEEDLGFNAVKTTIHHTPYSAVLTSDDRIAFGAIKALKDEGLEVPRDRSVLGFGNHSSSGYVSPPLTTVELPIRQMGELGAEILINNIRRKDFIVKRVKLKVQLIKRSSLAKRLTQ
jgi:LacI family transcriptional regulator